MMTAQDTLDLKRFPVVVKSDCKNISRIYPLKQKLVAQIYDIAPQFDIIKRIYIFGSSTTGHCHIDSDLDICIDADVHDGLKVYDLQKTIGNICQWNCDMIMYNNMGNRLKDTIHREGVLIYEQLAS